MTCQPVAETLAGVPGGALHVSRRRGTSRPVLAVPGVASTHRIFNWIAAAAPELDLVLPDLRGRGGSLDLGQEWGIARHVADLDRVIGALDVDAVDVVANSFGGAVAVRLAAEHPDRVRSLTLLDGGLPLPGGAAPTQEALAAALAPMLDRITREWPNRAAYLADFLATTSTLLSPADPLVRDYVDYDLTRSTHGGTVRVSPAAVVADTADLTDRPTMQKALARVEAPIRLLLAEGRLGPDSAPLYPPDYVDRVVDDHPAVVQVTRVPGTDHAGLVMSEVGAAHAVAAIRTSFET